MTVGFSPAIRLAASKSKSGVLAPNLADSANSRRPKGREVKRHPDGRIATGAQQLSLIRRPNALNRVRNAGQRGMPKAGRSFLEEDTR